MELITDLPRIGLMIYIFFISALHVSSESILNNYSEYRLIKTLLDGYDVNVRPVRNISHPVVVKLGIALNQIIDLDERNQILLSSIWFRIQWNDEHLVWDTDDYDGLHTVRVGAQRIWRPDITLYNDVRTNVADLTHYNAIVSFDGNVSWNARAVMKTSCRLDVTYFPYDQQVCKFKFGSWTFDGFKLDLLSLTETGDTTSFTDNGEWYLMGLPVKRNVVFYKCCPEPYPDITFYLIMRRRPLYYIFNLVLPCTLIVGITVLGFYLPPESGEKISLGVTVLLALTVFLLLVAETMPPQSEVIPLIGIYFGAAIVMLSASTALTVIVLNLHFRGSHRHRVPKWVKRLVLGHLARLMCMKGLVKKNDDLHIAGTKAWNHRNKVEKANANGHKHAFKTEFTPAFNQPLRDRNQNAGSSEQVSDEEQLEETSMSRKNLILSNILEVLTHFKISADEKEESEQCQAEWQLVAMVIDRLLLCIFVILTIVVSVTAVTYRPGYPVIEELDFR